MKKHSLFILAFLGITAISSYTDCFSLNDMLIETKEKLGSLFGSNTKMEVIQNDITRSTQKNLVIENNMGTIKIKTDWIQNSISLKAVKKATAEHLSKINIDIDDRNKDTIRIKTVFQDDTVKGAVDYTLMVPKQMAVRLKTDKGSIKVKRYDGQVWAHTENGAIEIANVTHKVIATVSENGAISIDQSNGPIQASTNNGNITINNTKESVVASAANGTITLQAVAVPSTSSIRLDAAGSIQVYLPQETNAHLKAHTQKGKVISEHYVTLASKTTKINNQAWAQLQKSIEGTLGSGEAEISLSSANGSVKILATEVA
jgi:hypothetical protein